MVTQARFYGAACALVFSGILVACLWPFHSPPNGVVWLAQAPGVRFERDGTVISLGPIVVPSGSRTSEAWTLELWLRPSETYQSKTILAFYNPQQPRGFSLGQWNRYLVVEKPRWKIEHDRESQALYAQNAFRSQHLVFVTLTSSAEGTRLYVDGNLVRVERQWPVCGNDLSGQLVIANSPVESNSWSGELRGLALYSRELSQKQVARDYKSWAHEGQPEDSQEKRVVALYLFNEGSGSVIHSRVPSGADLVIPERFLEVHHAFLKLPWNEYYSAWNYWKNVLLNVAGFVPLGFCLYAYLSLVARRPALTTVLSAGILSLTIETLQVFLPTRDSGLTDVISNTLGAAVGAGVVWCTTVICRRLSYSSNVQIRRVAALFACRQQGDAERVEPSESALTST